MEKESPILILKNSVKIFMHKHYITYFFFITFFLQVSINNGQNLTKIFGKVTDAKTGEPIPFANIIIKNTKIGTVSNLEGKYSLETQEKVDSIQCFVIGYKTVTKKIVSGKYQTINFSLSPDILALEEVLVKTKKKKKTIASMLVDSMRAHRKENDKKFLDYYEYDVYTKIEFDLNNITDKFKNRKIFKPFKFIFDYVDTSSINGMTYLPFLLIETQSKFFYRKNPPKKMEIIKASKISGITNESINQFLGTMYVDINVWNRYIKLLDKGFISPISFIGKVFYKYFILDSIKINDTTYFHIGFEPKVKEDYVFTGDFWIQDKTFALTKLNFQVVSSVNLNFVNNFKIEQEFTRVQGQMMLKKEYIVVDFNLIKNPKNAMGFFGKKTTIYSNIKINKPYPAEFYNSISDISVEKKALNKTNAYWDSIRPIELTTKEKQIYTMIDTLKKLPIFRTYYDIINTVIVGYYKTGLFEWGPYFKTISFNKIEGARFRIGGATTEDLSKKILFEPYLAYGIKDDRIKGGLKTTYYFSKIPWRIISFSYKNDLEQLGQSRFATVIGNNFLSSILTRNPINKLSIVEEYEGNYTHEWSPGISTSFILNNRKLYPVPGITFLLKKNNELTYYRYLQTTDFTIKIHFSLKEKFLLGDFSRISLGSKFPTIDLYYTKGIKDLLLSDFSYEKFEIKAKYKMGMYPLGHSRIYFNYGMINGTLPFPLLKIHEGNETYYLDKSAYNMMNYYEFISDEYISFTYFHYFDGFFLNKIPLIKKLKLRTIAWTKFLTGKVSPQNLQIMQWPSYSNYFLLSNEPLSIVPKNFYSEAGIGIENIFKFITINFVWRLTQLNNPNISKFGVRLYLDLKF